MYSNIFSEVISPDIFHICGKRINSSELRIHLKFTLKGREENESALDHPMSMAYLSFFTLMVGRKFDHVRTKREKIRKRHFKERMTFQLILKNKREVFSFLSSYHQGRMKRSFFLGKRKRKKGVIPNLNFFKPFSFADPETVSMWDIRDQPAIRFRIVTKNKKPIRLFSQFLSKC